MRHAIGMQAHGTSAEIDVDIEPIKIGDLMLGTDDDPANGAIEASELLLLGELVVLNHGR